MKKFVISALIVFLLACIPSVPSVQGSSFLGNPDPFAISCPTNYQRVLPHYCAHTIFTDGIVLTAGACTALDLVATFGANTSTSLIRASGNSILVTQNAIANRQVDVAFYNVAGCAGGNQIYPAISTRNREEVATAGNVNLSTVSWGELELRVGSNAGVATLWYVVTLTNCAVGCQAQFYLRGYFD